MSRFLSKFRGKPTSHPITPIPHPLGKKKPERRYRMPPYARFDYIIDDFLEREQYLIRVEHRAYTATYLYFILKKRLRDRELGDRIALSIVNDVVYMEKLK